MPRKSRWENIQFAYADFHWRFNPSFVLKVLAKVEQAAYQAMVEGSPKAPIATVESIDFPRQQSSSRSFSGSLNWSYDIKNGLVYLAELLWYRHTPTPNCIEASRKKMGLTQDNIKKELCKYRAQRVRGEFTHAWRLLDCQMARG